MVWSSKGAVEARISLRKYVDDFDLLAKRGISSGNYNCFQGLVEEVYENSLRNILGWDSPCVFTRNSNIIQNQIIFPKLFSVRIK